MSITSFIFDRWLIGLGAFSLAMSVVVLTASKGKREAVLDRLNLHRRRASGASTPPRSFSPGKKTSISTSERPSYANVFPPSRREGLPELAKTASTENAKILNGKEPSMKALMNDALPMTSSYNLPNGPIKYTPTGFSTAELKAMGDFPAYDVLSGVALPEPYNNFDITKALPRPYRPVRWAYHQTMCKLQSLLKLSYGLLTHG
jgi:hypothetical protein